MPNFNQVILMGNATRDPQLKVLQSGDSVTDIGIAINNKYTRKDGTAVEEVLFVELVAFKRVAEILNQYVTKGKPIMVTGKLKLEQWNDKEGNRREKMKVVVDQLQLLGGRDEAGQTAPPARNPNAPSRQSARTPASAPVASGAYTRPPAPARPTEPPYGNEQVFADDDIPF